MNYQENEKWIRTEITKNRNFSLSNFLKKEKIFESEYYFSQDDRKLSSLNTFLKKIGKKFKKVRSINSINWFKVNLIDNAIPDLAGLGKITDLNDLEFISYLINYDTADQAGDVVIGIFDETKKWIIKITNDQEKSRVYIRLYGKGKIIDLLQDNNY